MRVERRFGADRRKYPRGGRRPTDAGGYCPLVVVIERDPSRRDVTEAILLKLRFSVVPVESVEKALALTAAIRPDVIVCPASDAEALRDGLINPNIPVVAVTDQAGAFSDEADVLVENIRFALRARVIPIA